MTLPELVLLCTLVFLALVTLAAADVVVGAWFRRRRWFRRNRAERAVMSEVVDAIADAARIPQAVDSLRAAGPAVAEAVCLSAGRVVGRDERQVLARLTREAGVNERARRDLRARQWWRRLRAVRLLHLASDDPADVRVLGDPHPEVRAAALLWLSDRPDQLAVRPVQAERRRQAHRDPTERVADALLSDVALVRLAAKHVCVRAAQPPVWVLERALEQAAAPHAAPLAPVGPLAVVAALGERVAVPVDRFLASPEAPVRAVALRAAGAMAPDRVPALVRQFLDDDHVVRVAVADIAGRHPAATPVLLRLAADPAWQIRQVARRSLVRAGPVGRALLRRLQQEVA